VYLANLAPMVWRKLRGVVALSVAVCSPSTSRRLARIAAAALGLAGCASDPPKPPEVCSAPQGSSAAVQSLVTGDTAFAVDFFAPAVTASEGNAATAVAVSGTGSNVVLSPYSVSAAMAMVDVGAAGATRTQIEAVMQLPASATTEAPAYAALACGAETDATSNGNQLEIADGLWVQSGLSLEPTFTSVLEQGYDAPPQQVDFQGNPSAAASAINAWVSSATQGNVPSLLGPTDIDGTTRVVIVNAIYFKGSWAAAFDANQTRPQPFTLSDGTQISVPTMTGNVNAGVNETSALTVVELPYKGGGLAMDIFMPSTASGGLAQFESGLTASTLDAALAALGGQQSVDLDLPKFSFTTSVELAPVLEGMGIMDAFEPGVANLSGVDGAMDLSVQAVVQQALIEVDEEGTVAVAATAVTESDDGIAEESLSVEIDQPFLFLIRDTRSGAILFMGHVVNPSSG
jgi:serpin B